MYAGWPHVSSGDYLSRRGLPPSLVRHPAVLPTRGFARTRRSRTASRRPARESCSAPKDFLQLDDDTAVFGLVFRHGVPPGITVGSQRASVSVACRTQPLCRDTLVDEKPHHGRRTCRGHFPIG